MVLPPSRLRCRKVSGAGPQSAPETRPVTNKDGDGRRFSRCARRPSVPFRRPACGGPWLPRESEGSAPVCARRSSSAPELNLAPLNDAQAPGRAGAELPLAPPSRPKPEANHGRAGGRVAPREAKASAPEPNLPALHDAQTRLKRTPSVRRTSSLTSPGWWAGQFEGLLITDPIVAIPATQLRHLGVQESPRKKKPRLAGLS
jgi:hypothetical protein